MSIIAKQYDPFYQISAAPGVTVEVIDPCRLEIDNDWSLDLLSYDMYDGDLTTERTYENAQAFTFSSPFLQVNSDIETTSACTYEFKLYIVNGIIVDYSEILFNAATDDFTLQLWSFDL